MNKRRVVVTGIGLVSPIGVGVDTTWNGLLAGKSGIDTITRFDTTDYTSQIAGEVTNFEPSDYFSPKEQKQMDRFIQYGLVAATEAVKDAGLDDISEEKALCTGVVLGSGIGGLPGIEVGLNTLQNRGPKRISPFFIPSILTNLLAGQASIRFGFKGVSTCVVTACATGAHSIGEAFKMIAYSEADAMVAGGAESCICPMAVAGFGAARALSTGYNASPTEACRPFDEKRDGFVMAEGAGVLVLEEYEQAKERGANIYAEISGFGQTGDAYHITTPSEDGDGAKRAINLALNNAGLNASDIGYINAHATSTPAGDKIESTAIETIFGRNIMVSSTKSMTGHMLGAAGGVESAICALALKYQKIPPTINLNSPSEGCNLDYVAGQARDVKLNHVLNNSFGFGGTNASLVFSKV